MAKPLLLLFFLHSLFNITLGSCPLVKLVLGCLFVILLERESKREKEGGIERERERQTDSRLDRVDERTMIYQMAHCVFLFLGSVTLLNIKTRDQLGFSGRSVRFLGGSVLISHPLHWTGCAVTLSTYCNLLVYISRQKYSSSYESSWIINSKRQMCGMQRNNAMKYVLRALFEPEY